MNIRELAKEAGVSVATISRVINHPEAVLPELEAAGAFLLPQEASRPTIMTALRQRAMLLFQFFM